MVKKATPAGPSQRQLRVGELVRHALAEILQRGELPDPALARVVVTIPEVKMSPDLRLATAYVMPLGGKDAEKVVKALAKNKSYLRGALGKSVELRSVPDLRFMVDTSFDIGARMDEVLNRPEVRRDVEKRAEESEE
jgi:ribosome-binding factor A